MALADNLNPDWLKGPRALTSRHVSSDQKGHRTSCLSGLKHMVSSQGQMGRREVTGTGTAQGLLALQDEGPVLGANSSFL